MNYIKLFEDFDSIDWIAKVDELQDMVDCYLINLADMGFELKADYTKYMVRKNLLVEIKSDDNFKIIDIADYLIPFMIVMKEKYPLMLIVYNLKKFGRGFNTTIDNIINNNFEHINENMNAIWIYIFENSEDMERYIKIQNLR